MAESTRERMEAALREAKWWMERVDSWAQDAGRERIAELEAALAASVAEPPDGAQQEIGAFEYRHKPKCPQGVNCKCGLSKLLRKLNTEYEHAARAVAETPTIREGRGNCQPFLACDKCWHGMSFSQVHDQASDTCPKCKAGTMREIEGMQIPAPAPCELLCIVCAEYRTWAIFDQSTGVAVCRRCRDRASVAEPKMRKVHISEIPGSLLNDGITEMEAPVAGSDSERIWCMECGKSVSTEVPKGTIVRAWVECPECIEKGESLRARAVAETDGTVQEIGAFEYRHKPKCPQGVNCKCGLSKLLRKLNTEYEHAARAVAEKAPADVISESQKAALQDAANAHAYLDSLGIWKGHNLVYRIQRALEAEKAAPAAPPLLTGEHAAASPLNADELWNDGVAFAVKAICRSCAIPLTPQRQDKHEYIPNFGTVEAGEWTHPCTAELDWSHCRASSIHEAVYRRAPQVREETKK